MKGNPWLFIIFPVLMLCLLCNCSRPSTFVKSPEEVGRLVIADLLSRPDFMIYDTPGVHAIHYAEACAGYGALKLAGSLKDSFLIQELVDRYNHVKTEDIRNTANHVDANVYGILPLELFIQTRQSEYLQQGLELADGQWTDPLPGGLTSQTRFWIDDVYMIGSLQVQAYRATGNMVYLERAALEISTYIDSLQQENGLYFHGPDAPFFWGRGNGWVAAGLAELLSVLPDENPHYSSILAGYRKMMRALVDYQDEDGMWHQLIDHPESFKESSSTAMFGFAMTVGVKNGLLQKEPYQKSYTRAWNALTGYLNDDGKIREICVGTGQSRDIAYYMDRPRITGDLHGQAPVLWFANRLISEDQ